MARTVYFDMDGTIANLYGVADWLPKLRAYDPSPYADAKPLVSMSRLAKALHRTQAVGWKIGIISWCSKESTEEYDKAVAEAKASWLKQHLPSVEWDAVHIVPYGTPKESFYTNGDILFDDEERHREKWPGYSFTPDRIFDKLA